MTESSKQFATDWRKLAEEAAWFIDNNVGKLDHLIDYEGKTALLEKIAAAGETIPSETPRKGYALVRADVLAWLHGERTHPDTGEWFIRPEGRQGNYWWRRELGEATINAAPQGRAEEGSLPTRNVGVGEQPAVAAPVSIPSATPTFREFGNVYRTRDGKFHFAQKEEIEPFDLHESRTIYVKEGE